MQHRKPWRHHLFFSISSGGTSELSGSDLSSVHDSGPPQAAIALGSNLGDSQAILTAALQHLAQVPGLVLKAQSHWYRTPLLALPSRIISMAVPSWKPTIPPRRCWKSYCKWKSGLVESGGNAGGRDGWI